MIKTFHFQTDFCFIKHYKTIFKNYTQKQFLKTILKNNYQIDP